MTHTQYAIVATILPRLSDEDLAMLLAASENIEAQRHTPVGVIVAILPRLTDEDVVRLRELIELVLATRREPEAIHTVERGAHVARLP